MAWKLETQFYVVSRRLGEAMMSGRSKGVNGTIYGIFATREKAEKFMESKQSWIPNGKNAKGGTEFMKTCPAIIVEQ